MQKSAKELCEMNSSCLEVKREEEIIKFFKKKDFILSFFSDETIVKQAMEQFGLSKTAAQRYNQEYVVRLRERLNSYIEEQTHKQISKEEIINSCAEKFKLQKSDISDYIRRLKIYQKMDEMTQKLFEGVCF